MRIDECEPSFEGLRKIQWADLFPSYEKALKVLLRGFNYESEEKKALVEVVRKVSGTISMLKGQGFGFISLSLAESVKVFGPRDGERTKDLFFHARALRDIRYEELHEGEIVVFSIARGPKGLVAVDVSRA